MVATAKQNVYYQPCGIIAPTGNVTKQPRPHGQGRFLCPKTGDTPSSAHGRPGATNNGLDRLQPQRRKHIMAHNDEDDYRDDLNDWQDEEEQDLTDQEDDYDNWIDDLDDEDEDEDDYDFDPADDYDYDDEPDDEDDNEDDEDDSDEDESEDVADDYDDEGEDDEDDDLDDWEDDYDDFDLDDEDADDEDDEGDTDAQVKRLRRENAHRRIQNRELQENAAAAVEQGIADFSSAFASQLGLDLDDYTADNMAATVQQQLQDRQDKANKAKRDLAIYRAAGPAGADFDKLADSKTFTSAVDELDPESDDYADRVGQLVHKALDSNPEWKKPAQVKRSGGDFNNTAPTVEGESIEALQKRRRDRRKNQ